MGIDSGGDVIDLYTWSTPNGRKISIALEELGAEYTVHAIDIGKNQQFDPGFLAISPNNKIPAIVDRDNNRAMMESGAILLYLAEKHGKLMGADRWETLQWLMLQMADFSPRSWASTSGVLSVPDHSISGDAVGI